jgi:hypothetical protein
VDAPLGAPSPLRWRVAAAALAALVVIGCGRVEYQQVAIGSDAGALLDATIDRVDGARLTDAGGVDAAGVDAPGTDGGRLGPPDSGEGADGGELVPNYVFVSSGTYVPGALGGLEGADAICNGLAMDAGLAGTYVAFLSSSTIDAIDRLGTARGWVRPDGRPFADTQADLLARVAYPPRLDERGVDHVRDASEYARRALTGSGATGRRHVVATTCGDYTDPSPALQGHTGAIDGTVIRWIDSTYSITCNTPTRLYCLGIDRAVPVAFPAQTGRIAFLRHDWMPGGGIASADAACRDDAMRAGLSGTFAALIATTAAAAGSRFDPGRANWVTPEGLPVADTTFELMAGAIQIPLNVMADGTRTRGVSAAVFTGTGSTTMGDERPGDVVMAGGRTCGDWNVTTGFGGVGTAGQTGPGFFDEGFDVFCGSALGIYCLEQ